MALSSHVEDRLVPEAPLQPVRYTGEIRLAKDGADTTIGFLSDHAPDISSSPLIVTEAVIVIIIILVVG